jgi:hypothetical protein
MRYSHSLGSKAALNNLSLQFLNLSWPFLLILIATCFFTTSAIPVSRRSNTHANKILRLNNHAHSSSSSLLEPFIPPALRYHGGPVVSSIQVNPIFYGANVSYVNELETFYTVVTNSTYIEWRKNNLIYYFIRSS